jgi:hypothetical protein
MAYNDTLFQLGMDLTRSSPAQKEEYGEVAHVVAQNTASSERVSGRFAGTESPSVSKGAMLYAIMPPRRNRPSIRAERVRAA